MNIANIASWSFRRPPSSIWATGLAHSNLRRSPGDHLERSHGTMSVIDSIAPAESLWIANGLPASALSHLHLSEEPDPAVNSSFKLGTAAQTTIGLSGLAATHFHAIRTGVHQDVTVDARHAVLEFKSEMWYTVDGDLPGSENQTMWDELAGIYRTKDHSFVRIQTNFPHHRQGILDILKCESNRDSVARALLQWNAVDFETECASRKMCATALRSFEQWDAHPQGRVIADTPPMTIVKIGDAPKRVIEGRCDLPLSGIRVLDLSRVLSGPICGRTLAGFGADVLLVSSPNLPGFPILDAETSRGKRTTHLDINQPTSRQCLMSLVEDCDVFLQASRPGGLAEKGFGPETLAKARPGIVYASLNAYGWEGPWKDRKGFDSLLQTATGFNAAESQAYSAHTGWASLIPKALPTRALDHAAAYMLSFGIMTALSKTITEGGSWEVRVSLAAVGNWIRSLGRVSPQVAFGKGRRFPPRVIPQHREIAALAVTIPQARNGNAPLTHGVPSRMTAIRHAAVLSETPVRAGEAPMGLNVHTPSWLPRS